MSKMVDPNAFAKIMNDLIQAEFKDRFNFAVYLSSERPFFAIYDTQRYILVGHFFASYFTIYREEILHPLIAICAAYADLVDIWEGKREVVWA